MDLTGSSALGLPISVLSGIDLAGGHQAQADHEELIAIVSGVDFDEAVNGLGDADDATYRYLVRTRNFLKKEDNRAKIAPYPKSNTVHFYVGPGNQILEYTKA